MRRLIIHSAMAVVGLGFATVIVRSSPVPALAAEAVAGAKTAMIDVGAALGFRLEALTVEGREQTAAADLLGAMDAERGTPIAAIDVSNAREKIEALPWVKTAKIERRLPDTIHIVLEERVPYALWQRDARYTLVDHEGHLIEDVEETNTRLPLIVGPDAPKHAAALFTVLAQEPELAGRVRAAVRVGARRWNLHFDTFENGIAVRLPEDNMEDAWHRLADLERNHKILARDLVFVDLRLQDRLIVHLRDTTNAAATVQAPARATTPKAQAATVRHDARPDKQGE